MIYKFKSPASGDLVMLGPHGDQLLRSLGREPSPQGIIEASAMPQALLALQAAIDAAEQTPAQESDETPALSVGLRQRLWPMIEMLRRCHAAQEPVVWGV
jgi:hypothetical protein